MKFTVSKLLLPALAVVFSSFTFVSAAQADKITLHGASQFDEKHAFTRLMRKFEQLTKQYYSGEHELEFVMHLNSELGLEKDYVAYMNQGLSVDYAVAAPSHMSTFSKLATLLDPPMLYRDAGHWSKVLSSDVLQPIVDDIYKRADILVLGYGGGGVRHLIVNKPVTNMAEIKNVPIRVMGAPIQTKLFYAFGMSPNVIAYAEVYNAIQTGVIDAAENEAAGIRQMKFYEVGPNISLTAHSITVRPLAFSGKTLRSLPKDLQSAIVQAGKDAGTYGRVTELTEGSGIMAEMESQGKLKTINFTEREKLIAAATPVLIEYFKDLGQSALYNAIQAVK
ncbi:MAG TPA: TRAP transporter substrate-binding protein [Gammaproteobacteria bacterium]|jgi:TRAP-type C4-dicarboxylate transport system substrate-binding protein|nr:TRAP transporter substrate-binding protein [Gammaproteobacteria bacterium]HBK76487.1 C4-dicarboxylate ABC transporter substrate-binding protein [Gammaproteobacteria bacterium]HIB08188.1 TRAP transporter substrate-binding protein [Gammaproteobacteria bacterium]HIB80797.1 TRAP transporter substrate-binding protein [Gammaproteobacteria bacterium]HIC21373.1 TRAP transporter substrate-binding protein [Gammaproteobacteria bacterium]